MPREKEYRYKWEYVARWVIEIAIIESLSILNAEDIKQWLQIVEWNYIESITMKLLALER